MLYNKIKVVINLKTNNFLRCAVIRAVRTMAQAALGIIGSSVVIDAVDWRVVVSSAILSGIVSILTSVATGLPEDTSNNY